MIGPRVLTEFSIKKPIASIALPKHLAWLCFSVLIPCNQFLHRDDPSAIENLRTHGMDSQSSTAASGKTGTPLLNLAQVQMELITRHTNRCIYLCSKATRPQLKEWACTKTCICHQKCWFWNSLRPELGVVVRSSSNLIRSLWLLLFTQGLTKFARRAENDNEVLLSFSGFTKDLRSYSSLWPSNRNQES